MTRVFSSATLWRLMWPDLFMVGSIAAGLTYVNTCIFVPSTWIGSLVGATQETALSLPAFPLAVTATALGLLLVFRTNNSNARLDAGRSNWGAIINASRSLARLSATLLPREHSVRMLALLQAYARTVVFHLTEDGDLCSSNGPAEGVVDGGGEDEDGTCEDPKRTAAQSRMAQLTYILGAEDGAAAASAAHPPLYVLALLGQCLADAKLHPRHFATLNEELVKLEAALGACERIINTPIPTSYTRHTSRFLMAWLSALPFALWPLCGFYLTTPVSVGVAYALLAIEDIGVVLEEPFDFLPLWMCT